MMLLFLYRPLTKIMQRIFCIFFIGRDVGICILFIVCILFIETSLGFSEALGPLMKNLCIFSTCIIFVSGLYH